MSDNHLSPGHITQVGMGFWASKTLLSAVELDLFTVLADRKLSANQIREELGLSARAVPDFTDALVALGVLQRDGDGDGALYANTPETAAFLSRDSPRYMGGILEMANARLYPFLGEPHGGPAHRPAPERIKETGEPMLAKLYAEPERLDQFMGAMAGISAGNFAAFARDFDFSGYATLCDVGGATGQLSCMVADAQPHMRCTTFDLPQVQPIAERRIERAGLTDRVRAVSGDFFEDELPKVDLIRMGMILHDWNLEKKKHLIDKAHRALPEGGALVVIEALIDDARRENAFGLLSSLNMPIEFGDAFDYSGADFEAWCADAGFRRCEVMPLVGPSSAAIAYK